MMIKAGLFYFSGSNLCTCWMWTARPPAVLSRRGHMPHLKCFAFWCCMRTECGIRALLFCVKKDWHTFFIFKLTFAVPAPRAQNLKNQRHVIQNTGGDIPACSFSLPFCDVVAMKEWNTRDLCAPESSWSRTVPHFSKSDIFYRQATNFTWLPNTVLCLTAVPRWAKHPLVLPPAHIAHFWGTAVSSLRYHLPCLLNNVVGHWR